MFLKQKSKWIIAILLYIFCATQIAFSESFMLNGTVYDHSQLEQETHNIIDPYSNMSDDEFAQFLNSLRVSRNQPYFDVEGNQVWFGDRYLKYESNQHYHGITQVIWCNNNLAIHPLFDAKIDASLETICNLMVSCGIYKSVDDIPVQYIGQFQSIELITQDTRCEIAIPFQYIWTYEFTDRILQRIVFCVTNCWYPSYLQEVYGTVPIYIDEIPIDLSGWIYQDEEAMIAVLPLADILVKLGINISWYNGYEGEFVFSDHVYYINPEQHSIWTNDGGKMELLRCSDSQSFRDHYHHRQRFGSYGRHLFADIDSCSRLLNALGYSAFFTNDCIIIQPNK